MSTAWSQDETEFGGDLEKIQADFPFKVRVLQSRTMTSPMSRSIPRESWSSSRGPATFRPDGAVTLHLESADFQGKDNIAASADPALDPSRQCQRRDQREEQGECGAVQQGARRLRGAYVEAAKDRVTAISKLGTRNSDELGRGANRRLPQAHTGDAHEWNRLARRSDATCRRPNCSTRSSTSTRCSILSRPNGGVRGFIAAASSSSLAGSENRASRFCRDGGGGNHSGCCGQAHRRGRTTRFT